MSLPRLCYLDNAASTPPSEELMEFFAECCLNYYANQEASHSLASRLKATLNDAGRDIATLLTGESRTGVFWGNCGTELINNFFRHPLFAGTKIVTTAAEHPAIVAALSTLGANIVNVRLLGDGCVDLSHLDSLLDDSTQLVVIHHVNGTSGVMQDLVAIRRVIDKNSPRACFISDTIQSVCKYPLPWNDARLDVCFVSGYKVGAPGGAVALYRNMGSEAGIFYRDMRLKHHTIGRDNPVLLMTFVEAIREAMILMDERMLLISGIREHFVSNLMELKRRSGVEIRFLASDENSSKYILTFLIPSYQGAVLVRMLSEKGIMISSGSACESESSTPSKTLTAMGIGRDEAYSALRVSFWKHNSGSDADIFIDALEEVLKEY